MSAPKKDWIFTAVLVVLIAVLSAVVAMHLLPTRSASVASPGDVETAPAGEEGTTPSAVAPAGAETTYSPTALTTASVTPMVTPRAAARTLRTATLRTETTYSPPGRAGRPAGSAKGTPAVPAASAAGATSGTQALASDQEGDPFPYLGLVNPFEPIVTPPPTPPLPPPPTPPPNKLDRALQNWVIQYPVKRGAQWVFSDKTKPAESYTVEIGKPYKLHDVSDFEAQVTANGKWGVQFEYQGAIKKFSLTEP